MYLDASRVVFVCKFHRIHLQDHALRPSISCLWNLSQQMRSLQYLKNVQFMIENCQGTGFLLTCLSHDGDLKGCVVVFMSVMLLGSLASMLELILCIIFVSFAGLAQYANYLITQVLIRQFCCVAHAGLTKESDCVLYHRCCFFQWNTTCIFHTGMRWGQNSICGIKARNWP